jgi:hypothetical protein
MGMMTLKRTDQKHPSYDQPAIQLHRSPLSSARLTIEPGIEHSVNVFPATLR